MGLRREGGQPAKARIAERFELTLRELAVAMPGEELGIGRDEHPLHLALQTLPQLRFAFVQLGDLMQRLYFSESIVEPQETIFELPPFRSHSLDRPNTRLDRPCRSTLVQAGIQHRRDERRPDLEVGGFGRPHLLVETILACLAE